VIKIQEQEIDKTQNQLFLKSTKRNTILWKEVC